VETGLEREQIKEIVNKFCLQELGVGYDKFLDNWNADLAKIMSHHNARIFIRRIIQENSLTPERKLEIISLLTDYWNTLHNGKEELCSKIIDYKL